MSKAKKKGLFAFLLALLASAIVSGALLLSPATANAAAGTETADDGTVTISNVRYGNELFSAVRKGGTAGQPLVIRFAENTGMNFTVGEGGNLYDSATGEPLGAGNFIIYDEYTAASSITLDLNGGSITLDTKSVKALDVRGVDLTIMNGAIKGTASENLATSDSDITLENVDITFNYTPDTTPAGGAAVVTTENLTLADVKFRLNGEGATAYDKENATVINAVAKVGDTYYTDVKTAIESATDGQTVTLIDNAALSGVTYVRSEGVILDLGNYTLTIPEGFDDKVYDDEGKITGAGIAVKVYGSLTLAGGENGRIDAKGAADSINPFAAQPGGVITVNSGTIEVDTNSEACIFAFQGGKVIINGGSLINRATGEYTWGGEEVLVVNAASNATTPANTMVQVNGGTFIGRNPAFGDDAIGGTFITEEVKTVTYTLDGQTYVMVYNKAEEQPQLPAGADPIGSDYFEGETLVNEVNSAAALSSVLGNVADEAYIRLGASFAADVVIPEGKTITFDLNGKTLTNVKDHTILNYGTLIITDTPGGVVDNVTHQKGALFNLGTATLLGGEYTRSLENSSTNSWYAIKNLGYLTIGEEGEECSVEVIQNGNFSSLLTNGYYDAKEEVGGDYDTYYEKVTTEDKIPTLVINGGVFSGGLNTLKNDNHSVAEINGGEFLNTTQATVLNWNELTITGGTFNADGKAPYAVVTSYDSTGFNNGSTVIKGGEFGGAIVANYNADKVEYSISGGEFANAIPESYIAENCLLFPDENGTYSVDDETAAIAAGMTAVIGKTAYATLVEAVAAVGDGETITMIADDLNASGVIVSSGSNFTIDFNGHTFVVTQNLAGSTGTKSQVFQLLKDSTITMKNGTLRGGVSGVKMIIQNYADLTLEDMTLDAADSTSAACEALSVNNGDVVIKGNTQLLARDNAYAFDIYYWPANSYTNGATVTFDESFNGKVEGMVAYSSDGTDDENIHEKAVLVINGNGTFDITLEVKANIEENITANGGNFEQMLPVEYVGEGASLYTDGDGGYAVAPANAAPEGMNKVAVTVNGKGYSTIAEAIAAAQGDEIELSLYDDLVENVVIPAGKTVVLDLAGKTITNNGDHTIVNYGNLTIKDSSEQKSGVVDNITHARAAVYNEVGGMFVLDGARLARSLENGASSSDNGGNSYYVLLNHGTATLNGYISQDGAYSSLIENGWYNGSENTTGAASVMNIIGGKYSGGLNTVKNDDYGVLTISAGTFSNVEQSAVLNWNEATISGGTFQVNSNYAVVLNGYLNDTMDKGELTITGGSFHGQTMIAQMSGSQSIGEVAISGGEFSNMPKAAYFAEGYVAVCDDGIYKVKEGTFAIEVGEYKFVGNDLRQAILFAKDGDTVKLLDDTKATVLSTTVKAEITIDLNGKTITTANDMLFILNLKAEKDITIKNGRLSGKAINVVAAADDVHINISGITVERRNDKYPEESDNPYKGVTPPVLVIGSSSAEYAEYITNATLEDVHINVYVDAQGYSGQKAVEIYNANVTIKDSYIFADSKEGITINGVAIENSDVTVTGSEIISATGSAMGFLGALRFEGAVEGDAENFNTLTVENSMLTGYTIALSGNGSEGNSGTVINVIDSQLNSTGKIGPAIYHPQYGIINISGDKTVLKGSSGIEIRAGIANISGGTFTANAETFSAVASGNGTTTDGAAVAVVQHTTKLSVQVNITGGTFNTETEGGKTLYQADLQNNGEEAVAKIAMDVSGGEFNGAVESKNVKGFITGGRFAELPAEDAFAEGLAGELYDGYYMVVNAEDVNAAASIADRLSAQSDLRAYLASFGLTLADMQLVAESDEFAADIVAAYDEIFAASTKEGVAEALAAAMDAVDAYKLGLDFAKAAALTELTEYAMGAQGEDLAIVVVPTYAISAINAAVTADEIETYVSLAKAEMDDIRAQRAEAEQQYQAVNDRFDAIMQALGITGSAEEGYISEVLDKLNGVIEALGITEADGAWSTDLLDGITEDLETANENIAAMQELLGTAADEATAQTIIGMIKATQNSVAKAEDNIMQAISDLSSDIQNKYDALMQAVGELPADVAGALDGRLSELEGTVSGLDTTVGNLGTDIGELETAVVGLTTAQQQLTEAIGGYKSSVDTLIADMTADFEEISGKLDNLPTNDELAQALTNALSGVTEQLTAIKAEVDKIDGLDEAVIGGVSSAITEAFASFTQTFNTAMNGINTKLDSLDSAIAALPDDADITALKEAVQAATDAAKEAGTKVDTLGTTLSGRFDRVDSAITSIDVAIDGLTAAQNAMNEAMTAFRSELNTTLSGVNKAIAAVKADVKALADTAAADKLELLEKLNALQTSADAIEQAIASLDGDSSADLSAISAELAALQTSLGDVADVVDEVALGNTNSSSSFAGIYVYLSAILVLAAVILIVLAVKKRR